MKTLSPIDVTLLPIVTNVKPDMIGFPQKNFRKSLNRDFVTGDFVTLRRFNIVGVEFYYIYIYI